MKKVKKTVALFLAFAVIAISALASGSRVLTVFNKPNAAEAPQNLDIKLFWSNSYSDNSWIMAENTAAGVPFGGDTRWEPGYTEIKYFKIKNNCEVPFDYELKIDNSENSDLEYIGILAEAIDVFVSYDAANFSSLISEANKIGTLADCFDSSAFYATNPADDNDNLGAGDEKIFAVGFKMRTDAGNEYQGYVDANGIKQNKIKFTISAAASAPEPDPVPVDDGTFGLVWENTDEMLYRVGNRNAATISSLFIEGTQGAGNIDSSKVSFEWVSAKDYFNVTLTYTPNAENWMNGTLKFVGEGVGTLWIKYDGERKLGLDLEVLTAQNIEGPDIAVTSYDAVLLKDITVTKGFTVSNGHILYGNGFDVIDNRTTTSGSTPVCNMSGATLNNVHIRGLEYTTSNVWKSGEDCFSPCVTSSSNAIYPKNYILNSHISGCSSSLSVASDTYMENSLVSGGAVSNIDVLKGHLHMKDCMTSISLEKENPNGKAPLKGLSILVESESAHITLDGSFKQLNWTKSADIPSDYRTYISSVYTGSAYRDFQFTNSGTKYLNMGIFFINSNVYFDEEKVKTIVTDNTGNTNYGYIFKEASDLYGNKIGAICYTEKAATATASSLNPASYVSAGQSTTLPGTSYLQYNGFNIGNSTSNPNYKALTDINSTYCVYESKARTIELSYGNGSQYEWNPMILSINKYKNPISYTVSMNGVDYTNKKILFIQPGIYTVEYKFTDKDCFTESQGKLKQSSISYTRTLKVAVKGPYDPLIKFGDFNSRVQVANNNDVYVMPDVSETSSSIGSVVKNGITIYYPILDFSPTNEEGESYSSGRGAYFTPVFSNVNITDYNQSSGATEYTYNSSTTKWPHNRDASIGPESTLFGYASDGNVPYGLGSSLRYYGYDTNSYGLCYKIFELENDYTAQTRLVHFYYFSNNGLMYNYYVKYNFSAFTFKRCFASGTMMTLADGSRKPIENITYGDKLLVWNFFTGKYDEENVSIIVDHGKEICDVVNSVYSDGTVLRTIGEHGVFDYDLNEFVYLTKENCRDYIGHRFVKQGSGGGYDIVTMTDAFVTVENTGAYSITSAVASNAFAEGMLTVAPPGDFYNWIDMGDKLMYDTEAFKVDVDKYGLYGYDVFSDYVTYEQFAAFNGPYLKVAVEKGKFSFDYIIELIKTYL